MLFLAWIIHTFQNASQQPEPSVPLLLPKMLAKILEQGTTSWLCPKWAAPLYQIPHIRLHLRLPSPTQAPAAYLDSLKQNKGTIPSQSHLTPPWLQHHALCLRGFAWNCWAFRRADAAVWVTASPRNELLHIGCSVETPMDVPGYCAIHSEASCMPWK